ncbi:MAG: cysteine peptidase family C39 domain-containing protein [Dehalococcoidales bacterium]|nr:cysteine peptidase family C39 domain-containing protein [Dehalococcoidales bacterium]
MISRIIYSGSVYGNGIGKMEGMIIDLPSGRQTFDFDCGAKALQIVMAYYGVDVREDELLSELKCSSDGTQIQQMRTVAEKHGFQVVAKCGSTLVEVKQFIDSGYPVIVLVQAWAERYMTLGDWREDNDDGHYVIVIGHYNNIIVFEDPGTFRRTWLTVEEFSARWHDVDPLTKEKIGNFAMVLQGKEPAPEHKLIEHMD